MKVVFLPFLCFLLMLTGVAAEAGAQQKKIMTVNIETRQTGIAGAAEFVQIQADEITAAAQEAGLIDIVLEKTWYGAYPAPDKKGCAGMNPCFLVVGNMSFAFAANGQEQKILDSLQKEGFSATIGAYSQELCSDRKNYMGGVRQ